MSRFYGLTILVLFPLIVGCGGGAGGSNSATPVPVAPPTISLTTSSESLELGNSFTLNWSASNASSCQANNAWEGSKAISGSESFTPSVEGSYQYSLTCSNSEGVATTNITVSVTDSDVLFKLKVIDGYIEGANVFVDFNWNLQQDSGEPSATSDGGGNYTFSYRNREFEAINDVTFECAQNRVQVAEVPIGAVDLDRGVIEEPFTMYYVPGGAFSDTGSGQALTNNLINISPFTGLFLDIVSQKKEELGYGFIDLAQGCSTQANSLGESVIAEVKDFVEDLKSKYGVSLSDLYEDYLDASNAERAAKAEKVVNFLKASEGIKNAIVNRHSASLPDGYVPYVGLSNAASDRLFGNEEFALLEVSVGVYFEGDVDDGGWYPAESLHASELKLLEDGKIVDYSCSDEELVNCTRYEPTYENILNSLKSFVSYGAFKNESLIPNVIVSSQYREERTNNAEGFLQCSSMAQLIFDESLATCEALGCPASADYQLQINHNIGFSYPTQCDEINNSYIYALLDEKNQWAETNAQGNSREIYNIQYSLKTDSQIYSDPPIEFLGAERQGVDYVETYEEMSNLYVKMENLSAKSALLIDGEFIALSRTTFDAQGIEKSRYDYVVTNSSEICKEKSWDLDAGWVIDKSTEGTEAYNACLSFISNFEFSN